jgi:hypothetical protein
LVLSGLFAFVLAAPVVAVPVTEAFENALFQCDDVANVGLTHELGGHSILGQPSEPFPPEELIEHSFAEVAPEFGCGGPGLAALTYGSSFEVTITNMSAISYHDLFMVADPTADFSHGNWDGWIQGLPAMRIDSVGINAPLLFESLVPNGIFEPGETWVFRVEEFFDRSAPGRGPHFGSIGVGAGSPDAVLSNASILANVVPEPTTALLLACGLVGRVATHRLRLN